MEAVGKIFWMIAVVLWTATLVRGWFINNQLETIYGLCVTIGLMLIANGMIDSARRLKEKK